MGGFPMSWLFSMIFLSLGEESGDRGHKSSWKENCINTGIP